MSPMQRLGAAWHALKGNATLPPATPTSAAVLNDGRLIVLSRETGTLVFTREATKVLRAVLATPGSKP